MSDNYEKQYTELSATLKGIGDQIKSQAESVEKQIKTSGEMSAETRVKVDELLTKQGEISARLTETEQKLVNASRDRSQPDRQPSVGEIVSASKEMEGVDSSFRGSRRISVPRAAITSATGSGGDLVPAERLYGVQAAPERRLTIRDLIAPGQTGSNSVEYVQESGFTNNAAPVAEKGAKPYSDITFKLENAPVRTLAHLFKASRQILDDAPALRSFIDARGRYGLKLAEESQLLFGNGAGANIGGIVPAAQLYAAPGGVTVTGEQRIDRLRLALLQAELAEFPSDGIVLNPIDWALIELLKDANGRYLIGQPQGDTQPMLWRRPVVPTQAMPQDDFLVGSFALGAQIFDRMDVEILISTENDKDFENNMVTVRAEQRLALAVYRGEAFVTGPLTGE
ncbi:phage major capsid protein [Pseudomonas capeferrum]|uniref:phage major capsid protein n=1 Tax=Pseudomonas capeferrum TaxID=1495066 RepID=UPI0015E47C4A|nr:phage major capsid protein [Pseudomonas capeferrum]MBA1200459.1 phage major capsid protein [Pseudomonas capeferrum]